MRWSRLTTFGRALLRKASKAKTAGLPKAPGAAAACTATVQRGDRPDHWLPRRLARWPYLLAAAIAVAASAAGWLTFIERELIDLRFQILKRPAPSDLVVVAIDAP